MRAAQARTRKITGSELQRLRRILEIQRAETLRFLERLMDQTRALDSKDAKDIGDLCETNLSKEALFRQTAERRRLLRMIDVALTRMEGGIFGVCEACGEDINPLRLDALPWTRYCLRCQHSFEQRREADRQSVFSDPNPNPVRKAG